MKGILYGFVAALLVTLLMGPLLIPLLHKLKFGQYIRSDGPQRHFKKAGTPTMGGLLFLTGIVVGTFLLGVKTGYVLLAVGTTLGFGIIGFIDDFIKIGLKRSLGLRARAKLAGQFSVAILASVTAVFLLGRGTDIIVPFSGRSIELGPLIFIIFSSFVTVGTVNAVNLTDGLDGLAGGSVAISAFFYVLITLIMDKPINEVSVFAAALLGGCIGFLKYNIYPAKVFMGDTGSLALGGAVSVLAMITKTELFLPMVGLLFVIEALSVILQVISFRLTGKRIFRMSPLHHHFELAGWSEQKVVRVFWIISFIGGLLAFSGLHKIG